MDISSCDGKTTEEDLQNFPVENPTIEIIMGKRRDPGELVNFDNLQNARKNLFFEMLMKEMEDGLLKEDKIEITKAVKYYAAQVPNLYSFYNTKEELVTIKKEDMDVLNLLLQLSKEEDSNSRSFIGLAITNLIRSEFETQTIQ